MHSYSCAHQDKDEEDYVEWLKGQPETEMEGAEELKDMVCVCACACKHRVFIFSCLTNYGVYIYIYVKTAVPCILD